MSISMQIPRTTSAYWKVKKRGRTIARRQSGCQAARLERTPDDKIWQIDTSSIGAFINTVIPHDSPLSKWAIKKMDRIRRNVLLKGADEPRSGNCLVNWRRVRQPKSLGGLGIKDLACFKRALRLRWMWYRWAAPDKPWTELTIKMSKSEEELFKTCTIITLGNGKGQDFGKTIG